jgi:hypothetical protein
MYGDISHTEFGNKIFTFLLIYLLLAFLVGFIPGFYISFLIFSKMKFKNPKALYSSLLVGFMFGILSYTYFFPHNLTSSLLYIIPFEILIILIHFFFFRKPIRKTKSSPAKK